MDATYAIDDTTVTVGIDLKDHILSDPRYKALFSGIGCLPEEVNLQVDKTITPHVAPPRKNAISLPKPLDKELNYLLKQGILVEPSESEASEWVNSFICVKKLIGSIRECIDHRPLNKVIIRPVHRSKTLDEILPELARSHFFSKFDCTKGFWNLNLDYQSSLLTTTAFPEFHARWTRLGMGLKSSSDIFQATLDKYLKGLLGVICIADDIIVHSKTEQEHNDCMYALFNRLLKINMQLNPEKAIFCCICIPFFTGPM